MSLIRGAQSRRTETPNAVMTTLASPTQGGSGQAVWRVDMAPGSAGPVHTFDTEQVWTMLGGTGRFDIAGETFEVAAGDTVVLPADARRQVFAGEGEGLSVIVCAPATTRLYPADLSGVPACAVADDDKILPNWIA